MSPPKIPHETENVYTPPDVDAAGDLLADMTGAFTVLPSQNGAGYPDSPPGPDSPPAEVAQIGTDSGTEDTSSSAWPWQPTDATVYAATPLPERRYLLHGLIPAHGVTVWHALPASLKTQLLLDASACVATGADWLPVLPDGDGYTFPTVQRRVCWLNFDMANEDVHERVAAIARTHKLAAGQFDVVSLPLPWLDLSKWPVVAGVTQWIKAHGYGLVVIDNLANVKGSGKLIDESMVDVMTNVRRLSAEADCHVWLISHETKNTDGKSPMQRMYGGVHISALIDAAFSVTRTGDYVTISASKQRGHMTTTEFYARYTFEHDATGALDSFRFYAATKEDIQPESDEKAPLQAELLRFMNFAPSQWQSASEIAQALKYDATNRSVKVTLAKMADAGVLSRRLLHEAQPASKANYYLYCVAAQQRIDYGDSRSEGV